MFEMCVSKNYTISMLSGELLHGYVNIHWSFFEDHPSFVFFSGDRKNDDLAPDRRNTLGFYSVL